jgi:hypothetical protein
MATGQWQNSNLSGARGWLALTVLAGSSFFSFAQKTRLAKGSYQSRIAGTR